MILQQKVDPVEQRLTIVARVNISRTLFLLIFLELLFLIKSGDTEWSSRLSYVIVTLFILWQSIETEDGKNVHVLVINHESNIAKAAGCLKGVLVDLSPKNKIDEDLGDLLECFQIDILGPETGDDDGIQALLIQDLLQVLLILG